MTFGDWALLLGWVAVLAGVVVAQIRIHKRKRHQVAEAIYDEPEEALVLRRALTEWLHAEKVYKAMLRQGTIAALQAAPLFRQELLRAGITERDLLQATLLLLPAMSLTQLRSTAAILLRDKDVRRVIAVHVLNTHYKRPGVTETVLRAQHAEILRELLKWADPEPQRRSA